MSKPQTSLESHTMSISSSPEKIVVIQSVYAPMELFVAGFTLMQKKLIKQKAKAEAQSSRSQREN